ncbi:MAG: thiamine phosphate synthase [Candidatus Marinimicrobia bacterium]|nr:thiamine phosphate synthase [Candidatus Neomarinimicrobiota bacterium]
MNGYYFITESALSRAGVMSDTANALKAGTNVVQYRRKTGSSAALYAEALALKALCRHALFIVNDHIDIALAVDADGVHIGSDDLPLPVVRGLLKPGKVIGATVRNWEEAARAVDEGADYLGVGPIFATMTKQDAGRPVGLDLLQKIKRAYSLPLVAIGGITLANAREVIAAGADMICALSAVVGAPDVAQAVRDFQGLFAANEEITG